MFIANLLLGLTSIVSFLLAVFIYISNPKKVVNRTLSLFVLSIFIWLIANLLTNISSDPATSLVFARSTLLGPVLIGYFFLLFCKAFATHEGYTKKRTIALSVVPGLLLLATPTELNIVSIEAYGTNTVAGAIYGVLVPYLLVYFCWGFLKLYRAYRHSQDRIVRKQIKYIFAGIFMGFVPGIVLNGLMPALGYDQAVFYGPNAILITAIAMTLAIAKHRFLDIRSVIFRAVVYLLAIGLIGIVYAIIVFLVSGTFGSVENVTTVQRAFFATLALVMAITYAPLIKFFNDVTSKLFFRDAYDTQEVLDQIGKVIVGSIDLHKIQKSSLAVLLDALRPTYGGFILRDASGTVRIQDFVGEVPKFNLEEITKIVEKIGKKGVVYDELDQATSEYAQLLRKNNMNLVVPLITKNETIGHFIAGPKKSGNVFTQQDKSMMAIAANELAVALQNAQRFDEIQAFNLTLQEKVNEATVELKKTNRKLIELDEAKDEFISMASHQLRTPLTSIKGYLSMLMEGDMGKVSKPQEQALKEAYTSSQRMVFLISDFLNVSRIRTGKFVIEPKEVNLAEMISQELVQLREMAESKNLTMSYEKPAEIPRVKLDENKMHQVMMNMMDNAIYYTPKDGTINIQLFVDGSDVVFKVIDTGIGVPKAEQHKLFTKFFRAGNARKTRPDGTGLGLFMAQKVVVAQGGTMIFESVEGKGSTFGFRFKLSDIKA